MSVISNIDEIEEERIVVQASLDSHYSIEKRNQDGMFDTPIDLAYELLELTKEYIPSQRIVRFLDPAFGTGALYSALLSVYTEWKIVDAIGFERNIKLANAARKLWESTSLELFRGDFTKQNPSDMKKRKANLLVSNPPYTRHHYLTKKQKKRLRKLVKNRTGIELNGRTGLHGYFILLSHDWLCRNGLGCWIIPSELMRVDYGKAVLDYLFNEVTLLRIHNYSTTDLQFSGALVSTSIVIYKKAKPSMDHTFNFSQGGSLKYPNETRSITVSDFNNPPSCDTIGLEQVDDTRYTKKISDVFYVKRGIATGANFFFILNNEQIKSNRIPKRFTLPILPSPRKIQSTTIESDRYGNPILDERLYLISCDLPEEEVKQGYPELWKYYESGIEEGFSDRHLCRRRTPWYSQEKRDTPLFVFPYMSRLKYQNGKGFRFVLNKSKAIATNSYLLLYPKPWLKSKIKVNNSIIQVIYKKLNSISQEIFQQNGRVYAKNLWKLEPSELSKVPLVMNIDGI